ncbi:Processing alpha glucosidase I [Rhodotorula toruloides]
MRAWQAFTAALSLLSGATTASPAADDSALAPSLAAANSSLLWGSYRPGLYFGLRPRLPDTLLTGLIWFGVHDWQSYTQPRHECDQRDGLTYSYTEHDGRSAAKQVIKDPRNNVQLTIRFLKVSGAQARQGGSWAVRIEGEPLDQSKLSRISLINYFGNDAPLSYLELENEEDSNGLEGAVRLKGQTPGLGKYKIRIENHDTNVEVEAGPHGDDFGDKLQRTQFLGMGVPHGLVWQAKNALMNTMLTHSKTVLERYGQENPPDPALLFSFPNEVRTNAGLYGLQRTYVGRWSVDVFFDAEDAPANLNHAALTAALDASSAAFHAHFNALFPQISTFSSSHQAFARAITANLIGGIGYFHGPSIVDRTFSQEWDAEDIEGGAPVKKPELTESRELFSATPSRSFFPRGFYWDEGFHLALIGAWDNDLSLEIFKSWLNLADADGWIAREQILGEEARSRVPEDFQAQYPSYGNPPTLIMGLTGYIARLHERGVSLATSLDEITEDASPTASPAALASLHLTSPSLASSYLTSVYPTLKRHYEWFRRTQKGEVRQFGRKARSANEAYRWRGRTADHVLTSGLDDYPRAVPPHLGELHVDLASWMGFFARTMRDVAEFLGEEEDAEEFDEQYDAIVGNIEDLHWNEEEQMYCDASIDEDDESYHVCHRGYISLFPFLLSLLPSSSPHLGPVLELMRNPTHLWSPYGIRSLSKSHPLFGQGENYWRGPIWIQMNYLALAALKNKYAKEAGPFQTRAAEIYDELRNNVIENVHKEWVRTGTVWEQYNAVTGEGQRSDPFTGWTSLVTLIMAEQYY